MDKSFNPHAIESKWEQFWREQNLFASDSSQPGYCIMLPPPNVTGTLHMGHAFQDTIMDILIRYQRMLGNNSHWQMGTDHAGIATQMVVERQLAQENISRHELGREKFIEKVWQWRDQSGATIQSQMEQLGASGDWTQAAFTMDETRSKAVKKVFVDLYDQGLIYRGERLVNWDPVLQTAVSDLEVENVETTGSLWHINYPIVGSDKHVTIATTRPETLLGDVAIAVHPDDERYQDLIGQQVQLPLCDRNIQIIADTMVEQEFGSGCVKITPAHDFNDNQVGKRHNLPLINILTPDAKINENAPAKYQGMDRFDARKQIVKDLEALGLLVKTEAHELKIPKGDRSGAVIEPYLTPQWFVKTDNLAKRATKAVQDGQVKFVPETWTNTYYDWMHRIEDWCISRQLWWGHRIPAWYDADGNIYVADSAAEVRAKYNLADDLELTQDDDVLDTWFSSALWPFSTLGWPEPTPQLASFYPTNVLVTGFDIIFFWVARMIMMGLHFTDQVPFHTVYVHGLIQDPDGQKMSKSKGNVIDPLDLINGIDLEALVAKRTAGLMQPQHREKISKYTKKHFPDGIAAHGCDALRFTFAALASHQRHIRFDMKRIEGYKNFCNKLWNAARFVLLNADEQVFAPELQPANLNQIDHWILGCLNNCINSVAAAIENYRFDFAAQAIYDFTWHYFCDWYLELTKPYLNSDQQDQKQAAQHTLLYVLEQLLRLIHPIMPFISEEIWQDVAPKLGNKQQSIMTASYPAADFNCDQQAHADVELLRAIITAIRTVRSEMNISPAKNIKVVIQAASSAQQASLTAQAMLLQQLAKVTELEFIAEADAAPNAATKVVANLSVHLPLAGLIDPAQETERLNREITKLDKEITRAETKLNNPNYVAKAPEAVVAEQRDKLAQLQQSKAKLEAQLAQVNS